MKIYEYINDDKEETAKIFGFPVMTQRLDYATSERYQSFFNGLMTSVKIIDKCSDSSNKEVKILGKTVLKRILKDNSLTYYLGNKEIRHVSLLDKFKKNYIKYFDKNHDDIYILTANSGETYLILTYLIDALIKKNNSKKPLLVATFKYHVDMIKMICPDIPYVYIGKFRLRLTDKPFSIDGFRFFLLFNKNYFQQVEHNIKQRELGTYNYFQALQERLGLPERDVSMRRIHVSLDDEQNMLEKVKKTGLNLEKFVFLAPEAQSCKLYDEDLWSELITGFQAKGYDVFVNLTGNEFKFSEAGNYKTCNLTFAEAFALARLSKKIVSLRSGFTEFLLQTNVPSYTLYTRFRRRTAFRSMDVYHIMSGFSLMCHPNVDKSKIYEFNMYETSPKSCIDTILNT